MKKHLIERRLTAAVHYGVSGFFALFFLAPMLFMVISSFKPEQVIFRDLESLWRAFIPTTLSMENYAYVFGRVPIGRFFFNSLFVTGAAVCLGLLLNGMLAFTLARLQWPLRRVVLVLVIALSIVPLETVAVPLLVMVNSFPWFDGSTSWLDTYRVQILPFACDAFSVFLFYQFFIGIPKEFDEAAKMDGCSPMRLYFRILAPLSRSAFATAAILNSLTLWNSYLWPLMATRSEAVRPLPIGITALFVLNMRWGHVLAFASLITVPVVVVFLLFQRWFVASLASSGIKG